MRWISAALMLASLAACGGSGGDDEGVPSSGGRGSTREIKVPATVVFGQVTRAGGLPLAGATVDVGGATATTDAQGRFEMRATPAPKVVVRVSLDGYLSSTRTAAVYERRHTAVDVTLVEEQPATPLAAEAGGMVAGLRGAKVLVPANAFARADGTPVAGMVDVHLTPLDPGDENEVNGASGDFLGVDTAGGADQLLQSFGMLDVTVRQGGETLQVAAGQALQIEIPAPAGDGERPATVPLWSFDEANDRWVLEGEAAYDAATKVYRGEIRHMSKWNADDRVNATCITGIVREADDGQPLAGARVTGRGLDYGGSSSAHSGEDGRFYLVVRKNSRISVLASHDAGGGQVREVQSGAADTDIPPTPGDPRCLDVGEWTVEEGEVTLSDGRTIDCADVENPFANSCIAEVWGTLDCYQPWGPCDIRGQPGSSEYSIVFANGTRLETEYDEETRHYESNAYGSSGLCFTQEATIPEGDTDLYTFKFRLPNGQEFDFELDQSTDTMTIVCPNGERTVIDREDQEIFEACAGEDDSGEDDDDGMQCTYNGEESPAGPGGAGGLPEGYGQQCGAAMPCASDQLTCCVVSSGGGQDVGVCVTQAICDQVLAQQDR